MQVYPTTAPMTTPRPTMTATMKRDLAQLREGEALWVHPDTRHLLANMRKLVELGYARINREESTHGATCFEYVSEGEPVTTTPRPDATDARETPLQATFRRAAEEGDGWTWTPVVEGQYDVMLCRTKSHEKNPGLELYRVTLFSCSCPVGSRGKHCKHLHHFQQEFGSALRVTALEAAGGPSAPASCRRCLSTGKIGPRHFCSCESGQHLVQNSGRRRRVGVA